MTFANEKKRCHEQSNSDSLKLVLLSLCIKWQVYSFTALPVIFIGRDLNQLLFYDLFKTEHPIAPNENNRTQEPSPKSTRPRIILLAYYPPTGWLPSSELCCLFFLEQAILTASFLIFPLMDALSQTLHNLQTYLVQVSAEAAPDCSF